MPPPAGADGPMVVTTADNVLLTAGAVREVAERLRGGDDAVVALARKEDVLAAHPEAQRNFYRFRDGELFELQPLRPVAARAGDGRGVPRAAASSSRIRCGSPGRSASST